MSVQPKLTSGMARLRTAGLSALALATVALSSGALAQGASQGTAATFRNLVGGWSGGGTIKMSSGTTERIRCRAVYQLATNQGLNQDLLCASDSFKFQIRSNITRQDKNLAGVWQETTRNISGNVSGRISAGRIDVRVEGSVFSATLSLAQTGNRQAVTIRPSGTDVAEVSIAMTRSGG